MSDTDTIAAIATAPGEAGIAVVRVSGPASLAVADRVFRCGGGAPSSRAHGIFVYGRVHMPGCGASSADLDEAVLLIYRAPRSYTREDMIEVQCHGGRQCAARVLRAVLEAGARIADPGEFTRRAFLNGRIDLAQAEAVAELIRAQTEQSAKLAIEQLSGSLSIYIQKCYDDIMHSCSDVEMTLDFPDDEPQPVDIQAVGETLKRCGQHLDEIIRTWREGHILREGALVVIAGPPNAGKSTILNTLVGRGRAIVTEFPGTTRDTIEETVVIDGVLCRLVDTAGIRHTSCVIERQAVERTHSAVSQADLVVCAVDSSQPIDRLISGFLAGLGMDKTLVVLNKTDLGCVIDEGALPAHRVVRTSMKTGDGIQALRSAISKMASSGIGENHHPLINERHRLLLDDAKNAINEVVRVIVTSNNPDPVIVASIIRGAAESIGRVTGRVYDNDLLDRIFSKFCIGK